MQSNPSKIFFRLVAAALCLGTASVQAASIAVISNDYFDGTAADLAAQVPSHSYTGIDATQALTLDDLAAFDAVLLFEDGLFDNSANIGDVVADFALSGRAVIIATFYSQDRSDNSKYSPNGWGALESLDPNETDTQGTSYDGDVLDVAGMVPHPLTQGITELWTGASTGYSGGNQAKDGSTVLAYWSNDNYLGNPDPAIAYRITGNACVTHIGIIPHYGIIENYGEEFGGDYYTLWGNAMNWAASGCQYRPIGPPPVATPVPSMNDWGRLVLILAVTLIGGLGFRRYH